MGRDCDPSFSSSSSRVRLDFEAQVNILQKSNEERQRHFDLERDRLHEHIRSVEKARDDLMRDNTELTNQVKHIDDHQTEFEREQEKCRELYRKCVQLESQLSSTHGIEVNDG